MALQFRNLDVTPLDPVEQWGPEGLLAAIERGQLSDWRRIAKAVKADPHGSVAADLDEAIEMADEHASIAHALRDVLDEARSTPRERAARRMRFDAMLAGLTQSELAERLGVSQPYLSQVLSGAKSAPAALALQIAEARRDAANPRSRVS